MLSSTIELSEAQHSTVVGAEICVRTSELFCKYAQAYLEELLGSCLAPAVAYGRSAPTADASTSASSFRAQSPDFPSVLVLQL
jgi:hypothetical protein